MSDLGNNNFGLLFHKRILSNLAISLDRKLFPRIDWIVDDQEIRILDESNLSSLTNPFKLENLLDAGLEDPYEVLANALMPIPRVLYATVNPGFAPAAGANDLESLLARLDAFHTAPGVVNLYSVPAETPPLNNPCPVQVNVDAGLAPANRYTFVRTAHDVDSPPQIEVVDGAVEITITGNVYRGLQFSRRQAQRNPTATFTMTLRYAVRWSDASDVNLGPTPFVMVHAAPPGSPPLPGIGRVVYARARQGGYYLPPEDSESGDLTGGMFLGQVDDLIYQGQDDDEPRYRVEPRSDAEPLRFVLRDLCDDSQTILAEAVGGRVSLQFQGLQRLQFQGGPAAPAAGAIAQSLVKINPALAQVFTCAAGIEDAPVSFHQLSLLGPTSLDFPLLPRHLMISLDPEIVTEEHALDGDPARPGSVRSTQLTTTLTESAYFTEGQTFGLFDGEAASVLDFSHGADVTVALGEQFLQPALVKKAADAVQMIAEENEKTKSIPGLDPTSLSASTRVGPGNFFISLSGSGRVKTPFFLPDIRYKFTANIRLGFEVVPVIDLAGGAPINRYRCPIPPEVLAIWRLDPAANRVHVEQASARQNPLSFRVYYDPDEGRTCVDCPPLVRRPPPVYRVAGSGQIVEVPIGDPASPPEEIWCQEDDGGNPVKPRDNRFSFGQASFDDPRVKRQYTVQARTPGKKDIDLDIDVKKLALFGAWLISLLLIGVAGAFLLGAGLVGAGIATSLVANIALATIVLVPAADAIAVGLASKDVEQAVKEQSFGTFSQDMSFSAFLSLYLEAPGSEPEPLEIQEGVYINRYHAVIQAAAANEGFLS